MKLYIVRDCGEDYSFWSSWTKAEEALQRYRISGLVTPKAEIVTIDMDVDGFTGQRVKP